MSGFKVPQITEKDYVFGAVTKLTGVPLNTTGDWRSYLPTPQSQLIGGQDTEACVSFGYRNVIAITSKILKNFYFGSARELAIASNTDPQKGNDPNTVAETVRKQGIAREVTLPSDYEITVPKFYSPYPLLQPILDDARRFLDSYFTFGHEWVSDDPAHITEALTYSPLGVSVVAWYPNLDGTYSFPEGLPHNHWTTLVYQDADYYYIFDSAEPYLKKLTKDCKFIYIKRYQLSPPILRTQLKILTIIKSIFQLFADWFTKDTKTALIPDEYAPPPVPTSPTVAPESLVRPVSSENVPNTILNQMLPVKTKIQLWADAIQVEESSKPPKPTDLNIVNNNPGNLKYTSLTSSLGAKGYDERNFCIFPDYETGYNALCQFLTMACKNMLKAYHNKTLREFTQIYANPPVGSKYAENVALALNAKVENPIANFLS